MPTCAAPSWTRSPSRWRRCVLSFCCSRQNFQFLASANTIAAVGTPCAWQSLISTLKPQQSASSREHVLLDVACSARGFLCEGIAFDTGGDGTCPDAHADDGGEAAADGCQVSPSCGAHGVQLLQLKITHLVAHRK